MARRTIVLGSVVAGVAVAGGVVAQVRQPRMPAFNGGTAWLSSVPLGAADLRGHVVLVNFWTLTCINWLRTAAHVRAWSEAYRDDGLIVVGVHTPEFSFEHDVKLVDQATRVRHIEYPVVVDNDYAIWDAFANNYWPALYFVGRDGNLAGHHYGEGQYEQSERTLQQLLGIRRSPATVRAEGVEAEADWSNLRSPETYVGSGQGTGLPLGSDATTVEADAPLALNEWDVRGTWSTSRERITLESANGRIRFRFHARDAHLVLDSDSRAPIGFRVLLDDKAPGASHGVDVDEQGSGVLREGRMYQLIRCEQPVRERTLSVTFDRPGVHAYAFTFG